MLEQLPEAERDGVDLHRREVVGYADQQQIRRSGRVWKKKHDAAVSRQRIEWKCRIVRDS